QAPNLKVGECQGFAVTPSPPQSRFRTRIECATGRQDPAVKNIDIMPRITQFRGSLWPTSHLARPMRIEIMKPQKIRLIWSAVREPTKPEISQLMGINECLRI